jgi:8-oxo-dGTP pyrophosphatase MutT (NUDIX family)
MCNNSPLYVGNCVRYMIAGDIKDKLFVSFYFDPTSGVFMIDHEKAFARSAIKDQTVNTYHSLPLEHSKTCPCYTMNVNPDIFSFQSTNTFVGLACSTLVLDSKDNLLLTRRDKKLRSFPLAWVNPGGRLDPGESLDQCALRELKEEVGIDIDVKEGATKGSVRYLYAGRECQVKPFMVWESIYPTHLDIGFPKVQHLVVFYYVRIGIENTKIKVKIQDQEIDKGIWINLPYLIDTVENKKSSSEMLNCHTILPTGTHKADVLPSETFEGVYPNIIKEGIGQGHLIAIKNYFYNSHRTGMEVEGRP